MAEARWDHGKHDDLCEHYSLDGRRCEKKRGHTSSVHRYPPKGDTITCHFCGKEIPTEDRARGTSTRACKPCMTTQKYLNRVTSEAETRRAKAYQASYKAALTRLKDENRMRFRSLFREEMEKRGEPWSKRLDPR